MYSVHGLWSAAQLKLPVAFIVISNGCYKALDEFALHFGSEHAVGTRLPQLDFYGPAQSQGLHAIRANRSDDLDQALRSAFEAPDPILVEVMVDDVGLAKATVFPNRHS